mgnify:CR=1 FL=1
MIESVLYYGCCLNTYKGDIVKVVKIKKVGTKPVYDIEVAESHHYVLQNGVVTHNSGILYAADVVIMSSRSQEKKGTDLVGYNFNLNVLKGRHSREKAKIPVTVLFDGGLNVWSGLLEMAVASGDVIKPSNGWYQVVDPDTGEILGNKMRAADTNKSEFWEPILKRKHFRDWIERTFSVASQKLISDGNTGEFVPSEEFTMNE